MSQLQTQQALQPPPPPAPMPQSPMPPMMPAPIGGPAGQAPVAPPSGPAMAAPAQEVIPIEARLRKSAGLKQLEDDRSTEAAKNALGLRRGGVVGYKDGQTVEGGAPWRIMRILIQQKLPGRKRPVGRLLKISCSQNPEGHQGGCRR